MLIFRRMELLDDILSPHSFFQVDFWLSGYNGDTLWANGMASASIIENYLPGNVDSNQYDPRYKIYVVNDSDPAIWYFLAGMDICCRN